MSRPSTELRDRDLYGDTRRRVTSPSSRNAPGYDPLGDAIRTDISRRPSDIDRGLVGPRDERRAYGRDDARSRYTNDVRSRNELDSGYRNSDRDTKRRRDSDRSNSLERNQRDSRHSNASARSHDRVSSPNRRNNEMTDRRMIDRDMISHEGRPAWKQPEIRVQDEAPSDMTVTHVNQTRDLFSEEGVEAAVSKFQKSSQWLKTHSVEYMKLTMKDLVNKGKILRPEPNKVTGKMQQRIEFDAADLTEFEYKLNGIVQLYSNRIKWFLQGSRKIFGMVKGRSVAMLVDCSQANFSFGRQTDFKQALIHLIDEQLSTKEKVYMASFNTDVQPMWPYLRNVNETLVDEMKHWVQDLGGRGGTNLLQALKHIYSIKGLQTVCLVLGSLPDQDVNVLCDYVEQLSITKDLRIYGIAYECSNHLTDATLKRLSEITDGNYHCFSSTSEDQVYQSTDVFVLLQEIRKCQEIISKVKGMRAGQLGTALVTIMDECGGSRCGVFLIPNCAKTGKGMKDTGVYINSVRILEISKQMAKMPSSRFLPRPPGHDLPLSFEPPSHGASSSADWLAKHGVKAKCLDLYQVLAPNAFSFREEFVPVIRKTVQSRVHKKEMAQFEWHDGTLKNVHVDMSQLFEYQKRLGASVKLYEKRIDWLSGASRRLFGTITENNVMIILDLCALNANHIIHIQHTMRLVLEQQLFNREYFNIIGCNESVKMWKPTIVKPTGDLLQQAWRWVLDLECGGSRNVMEGLRRTLENDDEAKHNIGNAEISQVEGIYMLTSGVPDQSADLCYSYLEEACAGRNLKLHVVLFNVDDCDITMPPSAPTGGRYANVTKTTEVLRSLAHSTGGRFHWIRENGVIESDDISAVASEIDKALNFSRKCAVLVESVKEKCSMQDKFTQETRFDDSTFSNENYLDTLPLAPGTTLRRLPPKQTALSQARQEFVIERERDPVPKALSYKEGKFYKPFRPNSAKLAAENGDGSGQLGDGKKRRPHSAKEPGRKKAVEAFFYTGEKNQVGAVYKKYPSQKTKPAIGRGASSVPDKDEQLTTKSWMKMYSLSKLKLNLDKLTSSGSECHHVGHKMEYVKILGRTVEAKMCQIYPTINVAGKLRHLLLSASELAEYEREVEKILTRYLKRLQWLLGGSRRVFGTVVEKKCIVLIDTSGSMDERMDELKKELAALIWEQLYKHKVMFNLVRFSRACERWQPSVVMPTEESCHDAVQWISQLVANGNTCTLEALQMAFEDGDIDSIYLLTDGKPDTSTAMVLQEVAKLNAESSRSVIINTISFNCDDSVANGFLRTLSSQNRGRYHSVQTSFDAHLFAHQLIEGRFEDPENPPTPEFDGDDLKRLCQEIAKARRFLTQSRTYRSGTVFEYCRMLIESLKKPAESGSECFTVSHPSAGKVYT